jgi:HSP20 family protein
MTDDFPFVQGERVREVAASVRIRTNLAETRLLPCGKVKELKRHDVCKHTLDSAPAKTREMQTVPDIFEEWKATFLDVHRQVDEMFEELIYRRWAITNPNAWRPALDLHETEDAYLVEIDLPGVAPEELRIRVDEASLTLVGQRRVDQPERTTVNRHERPSGSFQRSLRLAWAIDAEKVQAECHLGVYRIYLPKKRPPREAPKSTAQPHRVVRAVAR